ncbi:MAG: VanZ family protein [Desulfovermiculus sp.]
MFNSAVMSPKAIQRLQQVIFWVWMLSLACVLYGSLTPELHLDTDIQNSDKILHILAYTWLAVGARMSYISSPKSVSFGIGLICLGIIVELLQCLVPGRFFSGADIGANSLGVALGLFLAAIVQGKGPGALALFIK